ncbi:MAG TPA: hypothetical protein VM890_09095 [Longimicrobium sp.]|jgi:hypothetical protein|nr:hypothetical protein [Longimicrobium sp.]
METWTDDRDPALQAALCDAYGDPPEADWNALRGAVMARAELPLARMRRTRQSPWQARFRALVPLAAAAGVVATAFALGVHEPQQPRVTAADRAQVEQILNESLPTPSELVETDQLLSAAIGS